MKQYIIFMSLILFVGCATPPLTENDARRAASVYANDYLGGKSYKDTEGEEYSFPVFSPDSWHSIKQTRDGWVLGCDPPAGPYVYVRMNLDGNNIELTRYGYSPE